MENWPVFWFETNEVWGLVDSTEKWAAMREIWSKGAHGLAADEIYKAKMAPGCGSVVPNFGTRAEHLNGEMTLGEYLDKHGVERS